MAKKHWTTLKNLNEHWSTTRDQDVQRRVEAEFTPKPVKPKTPGQAKYLDAIRSNVVTICVGSPGSGKSFLAAAVAIEELRSGRVEKIVVSRPLVECDEELGFLPGGINEKIAPYVAAIRGCFAQQLPAGELAEWERSDRLQFHPLATMRGLTFKNSFVLLDESQNCTYGQLRMFLTRFGENSKVVVNGDLFQSDITDHGEKPPLYDVIKKLNKAEHIGIVILTDDDIVRSPLVREIEKRLR